MPATLAPPAAQKQQRHKAASQASAHVETPDPGQGDPHRLVRLHITPFNPALLKVYVAPSLLPLAQNIAYHAVPTFPEKGYGYVELPAMEAQKLKKKLNGSTLKGSKVRIEDAKPEKRKKVLEEVEAGEEDEEEKPRKKKAKKDKGKKEQGVIEGVELPEGRKVKRGWTEPPAKSKKDKKEKKDKLKPKESKYTKEPELLFNAKLTPVAATEVVLEQKSKGKKDKRKKSSREVTVHEFENNSKRPSFLKGAQVSTEPKPAVDYVDGKGWVDEDGNVVEAETGKARNRRVLERVDAALAPAPVPPKTEKKPSATPEVETSRSKSKPPKKIKKQATPPTSSSDSESEDEESSVVSSSEDEASDSDPEPLPSAKSSASSPAPIPDAPSINLTPSSPAAETKEVHPLEALFKRPKPSALFTPGTTSSPASTPVKGGLAPINTSFSFFGGDTDAMEVDGYVDGAGTGAPVTPYTQRDLEWRGLRSAAPTPDTAAIGRRFSFPWRNGSQEADDVDEDEDLEAGKQLSSNTKANSHLPGVVEEDEDAINGAEDDDEVDGDADANQTPIGARKGKGKGKDETEEEGEKEESEFGKWFWENRGDNNRAWKKRRRDTLKAKRLRENKKLTGGRRIG